MEQIHLKTIRFVNSTVENETGTKNELGLVWSAYFCSNVDTEGYNPFTVGLRASLCHAEERELRLKGIEPTRPHVSWVYLNGYRQGKEFLEDAMFTLMRKELGALFANMREPWVALAYSRKDYPEFGKVAEEVRQAHSLEMEISSRQEPLRNINDAHYLKMLEVANQAYRYYTKCFSEL